MALSNQSGLSAERVHRSAEVDGGVLRPNPERSLNEGGWRRADDCYVADTVHRGCVDQGLQPLQSSRCPGKGSSRLISVVRPSGPKRPLLSEPAARVCRA